MGVLGNMTSEQIQLSADLARRLADAETRIAFQEDSLQTLSEQLFQQQQLTDQLQRSLQVVYQQLRDIRDVSNQPQNPSPGDEKPPHY